MWINDKGEKVQNMSFATNPALNKKDFKRLDGYMLRYVYFLDKKCIKDLTCETIPFSKIKEMGAGMYKGVKND